MAFNKDELIAMGQQRASVYNTIIGALMTLPDDKFLSTVRSADHKAFLESYKELDQPSITKGCDLILGFLDKTKADDQKELLETLAVDRTRLIRTPFKEAYALPMEGQYSSKAPNEGIESSLLALKKNYIAEGYEPDDVGESPDFFAIELDFLRVLALKMAETPDAIPALLLAQKDFLEKHPGRWIKFYVEAAAPHAQTDFYKGWLYFMEVFLELEKDLLNYIS